MKFIKFSKNILSILLVLSIITAMSGCVKKPSESSDGAQKPKENLDWLNTTGTLPIVKSGVEKKLKVAIQMYDDSGDPSGQWFYKFIEKEMNIKLEIEKFSAGNTSEYLSLMFVDGDLPDIIIGGGFGTSDLMSYGSMEGQLANLTPFITPEIAPNLHKLYEENPEYKKAVSDTDGRIWSLGYINDTRDRGQISRAFLNYNWLDDAGLKTPETLDQFINVLRAFKARGSNIVPMGGSYSSNNPTLIILNAMGYITEDPQGFQVALRNREVVIPVSDRNAYGEYLKVMNQLYNEGLIDKNFYTMDAAASRAIIAESRAGYIANAPFVFTSNFSAWWGAQPLTSKINDKAQWPTGNSALTSGGFVVSSKSQNKELAVAFADWFFNPTALNYNMSVNGPAASQKEYLYDEAVTGFTIDSETFLPSWPDYENNKTKYSTKNDYLGKEVYLWGHRILGLGLSTINSNLDAAQYGFKTEEIINTYPDVSPKGVQGELRSKTANDGEMNFRAALEDTMVPYLVEGYPGKVYLDTETATLAGNLMTIVKEYATQESAKFVTGRRPLSEIDKYFDEIEKLGAKDVLKIYSDYYASIK